MEGTFVWWDGSTPSYTAWAGGEPNDLYGEDCASISYYRSAAWNDVPCIAEFPFVCESI